MCLVDNERESVCCVFSDLVSSARADNWRPAGPYGEFRGFFLIYPGIQSPRSLIRRVLHYAILETELRWPALEG
jgi:hypothetical protein